MVYVYNNIDDRLCAYIRKTPTCWIWVGHKNEHGYGIITNENKKQVKAHRFIYEQTYGAIPPKMNALHKCDNPACVNPQHIYLGTQKDNVRDMMERNRGGYKAMGGDDHPNRKITMDKANEIRRLWSLGGVFQRELGEKFGISQAVVSKILRGQAWTWSGSKIISNKK